eukprot:GHVQ01006011.1.p1 GENE.GHVQ01006011.1~~GHVQ01006011.1.p1  ORF type:complete len:200 (+),score=30.06 GHVQ01006011.1:153-752(+)
MMFMCCTRVCYCNTFPSVGGGRKLPLNITKAKPELPPVARKPIGFRGNHNHGKPLYDPVYPTTKVPPVLKSRYRRDWRNAGRAMITVGMATIEGLKQLRRHQQCIDWQHCSPCGARCGGECGKSPWRCLCGWRVRGVWQHMVSMDGLLCVYKGGRWVGKSLDSGRGSTEGGSPLEGGREGIDGGEGREGWGMARNRYLL